MNKRLKVLRAQLGMSQKQFGEKLHLSVSQISSYENNYRNIPNVLYVISLENLMLIQNGSGSDQEIFSTKM